MKICETCENPTTMEMTVRGYIPKKESIIIKIDKTNKVFNECIIYTCEKCFKNDILMNNSSLVYTSNYRKISKH